MVEKKLHCLFSCPQVEESAVEKGGRVLAFHSPCINCLMEYNCYLPERLQFGFKEITDKRFYIDSKGVTCDKVGQIDL